MYAYINASFESGFVNPIDAAIRNHKKFDISAYKKLDEEPYDFIRKRLSILVSGPESTSTNQSATTNESANTNESASTNQSATTNESANTNESASTNQSATTNKSATTNESANTNENTTSNNIASSNDKKRIVITKGALQNVLTVCTKAEMGDGKIIDISTVKDKIQAKYYYRR